MQSEPSSRDEPNGLCRCGHTRNTHPLLGAGYPCVNQGCTCGAFVAQSVPTVINNRCKCSHDRFRHCYDTVDGPCSKPGCDCQAYAPVTVETVELPDPGDGLDAAMRDLWEASDRESAEMVRRFAARAIARQDVFPEPKPFEIPSIQTGCAVLHKDAQVNTVPCPDEAPAEPEGYWKHPEDKTHEDCPTCWGASEVECMCCTPALADQPWVSPQPERRPPLTVQYSVAGGHPYEVSIPGDASVTAEDGVLIIKHPSAQILAITRVTPMED